MLYATIAFAVALSLLTVAFGLTTWSQEISWTFAEENKSFSVDRDDTELDYGLVVGGATKEELYTITNDGNVDITVSVSGTQTGSVSPDWNQTSVTLAPAKSTTFKLILTITGAESYTVTFNGV
jgi:hypothetical protein